MRQRLAPFLVLLEARYAPLLFAVAPQAYAVYLWLWRGSDSSSASFWFAIMGALGYELVYVGAIAWAEEGRSSVWTWMTATVALLFSVAVAYYVYSAQGAWAWLHAGFPLVAFAYTLNMHTQPKRSQAQPQGQALALAVPQAPVLALTRNGHKPQEETATEALGSLVTVVAPQASFPCPHCSAPLGSKQALGAAVRNKHCPSCK